MVRADGVRIDATRSSVFDVLIDPDARRRWLGPNSRVERASMSIYDPRVRTAAEVWPAPGNDLARSRNQPSVTILLLRADGSEVALNFMLHAIPFATIVELHHQERSEPTNRHRRSRWRAAHWRRRCLEALRHEVESRAPRRIDSRRRRPVPTSSR